MHEEIHCFELSVGGGNTRVKIKVEGKIFLK